MRGWFSPAGRLRAAGRSGNRHSVRRRAVTRITRFSAASRLEPGSTSARLDEPLGTLDRALGSASVQSGKSEKPCPDAPLNKATRTGSPSARRPHFATRAPLLQRSQWLHGVGEGDRGRDALVCSARTGGKCVPGAGLVESASLGGWKSPPLTHSGRKQPATGTKSSPAPRVPPSIFPK